MKDRIKLIIEQENISYSKFADIINIQRSGISHIINGRNKPSLEVIQKILEAFKYIDTDWLLFGKGDMIKKDFVKKQDNLFSDKTPELTENEDFIKGKDNVNLISKPYIEDSTKQNVLKHSKEDKLYKKKIERIIIFYTDKSFSEYTP